jgi:hypothetical protein
MRRALRPKGEPVSSAFHLSRYAAVLAAVWVLAMKWRLYPQFKDTLRDDDGHLVTLAAYVEDSCGQRIGPGVESCLAEARATGRRLVAREQAKSILLIEAPLLAYLLIYAPARWVLERWRRRGASAGMPGRAALE